MTSKIFTFLFVTLLVTYSQTSWQPVPGLTGSNIYRTIFNSEDVVFTYILNGGMWKSTSFGSDWYQINYGLNESKVLSLAIGGEDVLFVGTDGDGVYRSHSDGSYWEKVLNVSAKITAIGGSHSGLVCAGATAGRVFKTTDNGENWTTILDTVIIDSINDICVTSNETIYVGCNDRQLFISSDAGNNWVKTTVGVGPANNINSIIVGKSGSIFIGVDHGGVFRSADDGKSWKPTSNGMPPGANVILLNVNSLGNLFAVLHDNAVYKSTDQGENWNLFDEGLNNYSINTIASSSNGKTLLGTSGGLFISEDFISQVEKPNNIDHSFILLQNYPNPFNPATNINFSISNSRNVTLKIFNATGQEIMTLIDKKLLAGSYSVKFDGSNLSSGVYFYKLSTENLTETRKMILMR